MDPDCSTCHKGRSHICAIPICLEKHVTPCANCWTPICDTFPCSIQNLGLGKPRICSKCIK